MALEIDYTARVLENQAVPIKLLELDAEGRQVYDSKGEAQFEVRDLKMTAKHMMRIEQAFSGYTIRVEEPEFKSTHVLDVSPEDGKQYITPKVSPTGNNILREQVFYGAAALEQMSSREPLTAVIRALAILLEMPEDWVGDRMIYGDQEVYMASISMSIQIAQGVDPTRAAKLLESSVAALALAKTANDHGLDIQIEEQNKLQETIETAVEMLLKARGIPGSNGSESGQENSVDPTTNSLD